MELLLLSGHFLYMMSYNFHSSPHVGIIISAIFTHEEAGIQKTKEPTQGHKSRELLGRESNPGQPPASSSPQLPFLVWGQGPLEAQAAGFPFPH